MSQERELKRGGVSSQQPDLLTGLVETSRQANEFRTRDKTREEAIRALVFNDRYAEMIIPADEVRRINRAPSGFFVREDGRVQHSHVGQPMTNLFEVGFYRVDRKGGSEDSSRDYIYANDKHSVVVPVIGKFYLSDREATDEELKKMGITRLLDNEGKPVTYPMYVATSRKGILLADGEARILNVGGKRVYLGDQRDMEQALELAAPGAGIVNMVNGKVAEMMEGDSANLKSEFKAYQGEGGTQDEKEYMEDRRGDFFHLMGNAFLQVLERQGDVTIERQRIVGLDNKGWGIFSYQGHYIKRPDDISAPLPDGLQMIMMDRWEDEHEETVPVIRRELQGKSGLFLCIPYQPHNTIPPGADTATEAHSIERERIFMLNGGVPARITITSKTIATAEEVFNATGQTMPHPAIAANLGADLEETRRMELFFEHSGKPRNNADKLYKHYICERFDIRLDDEKGFKQCRDLHIAELSKKLGESTKGILDSGWTVPTNQRHVGNVNLVGGVTDFTALANLKAPFQALSTIMQHIHILDGICQVAGLNPDSYFRSENFNTFLNRFMGKKHGDMAFNDVKDNLDSLDFRSRVYRIKIGGMVTDEWMNRENAGEASVWQMSDDKLIEYVRCNTRLIESEIVDKRLFANLCRVSRTTHRDKTGFHPTTDMLRGSIDQDVRLRRCPTIQDAANEIIFPDQQGDIPDLGYQTPAEFISNEGTPQIEIPTPLDYSKIEANDVMGYLKTHHGLRDMIFSSSSGLKKWEQDHNGLMDSQFRQANGMTKLEYLSIITDNIFLVDPESAEHILKIQEAKAARQIIDQKLKRERGREEKKRKKQERKRKKR